eukprot:GDKI01043219.1.p1 GENE.GDKI01043219.1~~GDKI01043219.1.p1  ORF type:complete len:100 (+),score=30.86 GDKI01043219.1:67-366(+)
MFVVQCVYVFLTKQCVCVCMLVYISCCVTSLPGGGPSFGLHGVCVCVSRTHTPFSFPLIYVRAHECVRFSFLFVRQCVHETLHGVYVFFPCMRGMSFSF